MFSSDEKEVRLAEANAEAVKALANDLLIRCERWLIAAHHRKLCIANRTRDESQCSCGRNGLLLDFIKARDLAKRSAP